MTQLKPIEKWKFNLQIALAILVIIIYCTRAILFITFEAENKWVNIFNSFIWYISTLFMFILSGFQIVLFRPIRVIKNLAIVGIVMYTLAVTFALMRRIFHHNPDVREILSLFDAVLDVATIAVSLALYINMMRKKFDTQLVIKMLRPYAIVSICIVVLSFLVGSIIHIVPISPSILFWQWGANYFILTVPIVFLILYYQKIKTIYPKLVEGKFEEPTQNWPPPSTI